MSFDKLVRLHVRVLVMHQNVAHTADDHQQCGAAVTPA